MYNILLTRNDQVSLFEFKLISLNQLFVKNFLVLDVLFVSLNANSSTSDIVILLFYR